MFGVWAALLLAIQVNAAGDCPAAAEVQRRLDPLLGDAPPADVATIRRAADGSVSVALDDAAGHPVGSRRLPRAASCAEQAETVAVMLAIWEAQIHPEISLRLDRLSPPPAPPPAPVPVVVAAPPAPVVPRKRAILSLGVAATGDWQEGAWAPGGRLDLTHGRAGGRWRVHLGVVGNARHTLDVPPGQARWWRMSAVLGAEVDVLRGERWAAVLGVGAVAGLVSIKGEGFAVNQTARSLAAGAEVAARAQWRPGRVQPWVGVSLTTWVRRQAVDLQDVVTSAELPRLQPAAAVGADFVW